MEAKDDEYEGMCELASKMVAILAADPEIQRASYPSFVVLADEIALDIDDVVTFFHSREWEHVPQQIASLLEKANSELEAISGEKNAECWTMEALSSHPTWVNLRAEAREVATSLGLRFDKPVNLEK